ncbi:hypothetical protein KUTeg_022288, partial [Tegillarca granosa]
MATVFRLLKRLEDMGRNRNVRRVFVDRQNPLECLGDEEIFVRFGVGQVNASDEKEPATDAVTSSLGISTFLANGAYRLLIGDRVNISKATAGKCIRRVGEAISSSGPVYRFFQLEMASCSERFPNVISCIERTQVRITKPNVHEKDFVNRKGFHSFNVQ